MSAAEILAELPRLTEAERALIRAKLRDLVELVQIVEPDMDIHPLTDLPILRISPGAKTIDSDAVHDAMAE